MIVGVLPINLINLTFGHCFDKPLIVGVLPKNLTHLTFGKKFNKQLISGVLPSKLSKLIISNKSLINDMTEMIKCNIEEIGNFY